MNDTASTPPPIHDGTVGVLLKAPERVAGLIAEREKGVSTSIKLLCAAILFHAIFGFAMGLFGGWNVAGMATVKAPLVALCSLLVCYPSLFVFGNVGGAPLSPMQSFLLGASCLAMQGLLLVGLAPVAWLFAVSTESLPFVTLLVFFIWGVTALFVMRFVGKLRVHALFKKSGGIIFWFLIFMLVTLQMTTCLRPMLTTPKDGWWTAKKMFFLQHYGTTFEKGSAR